MKILFSPHIQLAHECWLKIVSPEDLAIDMTCGNGHDTVFLAKHCGFVIGIDIQIQAIDNTKNRLLKENLQNVELRHQSHIIPQILPKPPRLIVYNLGYLPGGDKSIVTKTEDTLESITRSLSLIAENGAISITCYPGHNEGMREEAAIVELVKKLPATQWRVIRHEWINRVRSPTLIMIQRSPNSPKNIQEKYEV